MKHLIVKVCGMRLPDNIAAVDALGVDLMGFILVPESPRYVAEPPAVMPSRAERVGVFVDADPGFVCRKVTEFGLGKVQFHGHETPLLCLELVRRLPRGVTLIKAFGVDAGSRFPDTSPYEGLCEYFIFDTASPQGGGSGRQFDWSSLSRYRGRTPFLLSGGIGPDSLEALRDFRHPMWAGVDLNSRFETGPARKAPLLLSEFINSFRKMTIS